MCACLFGVHLNLCVENQSYASGFNEHLYTIMQPAKSAEHDFERLAAKESAHIGKLLGDLLKKKYPDLHPDIELVSISFDDLLQWRLWPNFIKLYGKLTVWTVVGCYTYNNFSLVVAL